MPLLIYALVAALLPLGVLSLQRLRRHRRRQLHDLLYVAAALAWVSACSDGTGRHAG